MTSDTDPQMWEIWHARFNYDDKKGYKYRPVIIVGKHEDGSLVMMVTSSTNKLSLPHDCRLHDWQAAGLKNPSLARVDRVAVIPQGYIGTAGRIGKLSEADRAAVSSMMMAKKRDTLASRPEDGLTGQ